MAKDAWWGWGVALFVSLRQNKIYIQLLFFVCLHVCMLKVCKCAGAVQVKRKFVVGIMYRSVQITSYSIYTESLSKDKSLSYKKYTIIMVLTVEALLNSSDTLISAGWPMHFLSCFIESSV